MTADTTGGFADFYAAHFQRLAVQLHAYLGDHAEAQDLAQEAFCRALDRWSRVGGYDDPSGWVRRVAWNLATSRIRRRQTIAKFLARQREEHIPGPSPDRIALKEALAAIPPKHRQAIVQFHIGHFSTAEIAEQEGVAEGTVRSWLSRGRSELADYFTELESASPIKPAGVAAATETVRRRRRNRIAAVAAMVLLAVAIPVAIVLANRVPDRPPVVTPSPTPSPLIDDIPTRKVGGLTGMGQVDVVSDDVIWIYSQYEEKLRRTTDSGFTWHDVRLPDHTAESHVQVMPYSKLELIVFVDSAVHISVDGGNSYSATHPKWEPGKLALLALWRQHNHGVSSAYAEQCPGHTSSFGANCAKSDVVEIGKGPLPVQPGLPGQIEQVISTSDGRVWVRNHEGSRDHLAYARPSSSDKKWTRLPEAPAGSLHVSPDGKDVWVYSEVGEVWQLNRDKWVKPALLNSIAIHGIVAWGNGTLAVETTTTGPHSVALWTGKGIVLGPSPTCAARLGLHATGKGNLIAGCESMVYVHNGRQWIRIVP